MNYTMTDHYGWSTGTDGSRLRSFTTGPGMSTLVAVNSGEPPRLAEVTELHRSVWHAPERHQIRPELWEPLAGLLPLYRIATPTLWESAATAIVRQVVRAAQARTQYTALCDRAGEAFPGTRCRAFPTADAVLALSVGDLADIGLKMKAAPLRSLAEAWTEAVASGKPWESLDPSSAYEALLSVPRIGPWTAGVAVWDWSNDPAFYPFDDLAVQTWAKHTAPGLDWPDRKTFGPYWTELTGPHRALMTILVLARGNQHAAVL